MAFDIRDNYFLVRLEDCAKYLSQEELDILQGLIKKVEILSKRNDDYIVISKKQHPTLFSSMMELISNTNGDKNARISP